VIDFYFWPTPNGHKISIALEEFALDYSVKPVNILKGEQHEADFLAISPNNRVPAIVDDDGPAGTRHEVFESGAILLYLCEKTGKFWSDDSLEQSRIRQWLFFQCANIGPMFGQCGHFRGYADEQVPYAIKRYSSEVQRLYGLVDSPIHTGWFRAATMASSIWLLIRGWMNANRNCMVSTFLSFPMSPRGSRKWRPVLRCSAACKSLKMI